MWTATTSSILVAIAAICAIVLDSAFLFVSLGAIVHEYVERPLARASSPRSMVLGNAISLIVGFATLAVFGLADAPPTMQVGVSIARACAVVVAIAVATVLLVLAKAVNPPAASTLFLVTLGIAHRPLELVYVFAMIVAITVSAWFLNRLGGIQMPVWSSPDPAPRDSSGDS